jgi:tungstate transport system substrate-binding protein
VRRAPRCVAAALLLAALPACGRDAARPGGGAPAAGPAAAPSIRLATTTSARDTGLLDVLLPAFRADAGIEVLAIAVGTGEALKLAERGDADVVIVHARKAEDAFLAAGSGVERKDLWWNRFLILGPQDDPASAGFRAVADGAESRAVERDAADALRQIRARGATFVSRGDDSGTHKRELELWGGRVDRWPGYLETGQGMGPTLVVADEKGAYVLCDEGTYLASRGRRRLVPLVGSDPRLKNPYGGILPRAADGAADRFAAAKRFLDWLVSPRCRDLVRGFRVDGERAFYLPDEAAPASPQGGR